MYELPGVSQHAANVYGIRIAYRKAGAGAPVVLVHGLAYSWLTWAANMPALAQHFTVYAPDLPGHGDSDRPRIAYDMDLGVRLLGRFLERLETPPVTLIGHSLGGALALKVALDYPKLVSHLVLVDSAGLGRQLSLFLRLLSVPGLGEVLLSGRFITVRGMGKRLFRRPELVDLRLLRALHRARTAQLADHVLEAMARAGASMTGLRPEHNLLSRLGELSIPILAVWGERDRVLPVDQARELARRYPQVPVHVIPGAGHWPHMEDAETFNRLVVEFLALRPSP